MKPLCHVKCYASPHGQEGMRAWLWMHSRAHRCVLISMGMDPSSSSDECLPLKSSPILNFALLCPVSSRFSPPPHPTPVCRLPVDVFPVSAQSNLPQGPALG